MTTYQWLTLAMGAAGFVITWGLGLFKAGRMVEEFRSDLKDKIAEVRIEIKADIDKRFAELLAKFDDEQRTQDNNVGEMGSALRRHIETVHEKLREVEIWSRDHFVQKPELERVRQDIKDLAHSIKEDFKDIAERIDRKN